MNLDELVPAPNAQKVNKIAKRVFGYSLDLENISETKANKLHKNLSEQMKLYESKLGSEAQKRTKYYEMKLALEALSKHIAERNIDVDEDDVEEDNAFNSAAANAKKAGKSHFMFNGKKYKVKMDDKTADALTDDVQEVQEDNSGMPFGEVIYQYVDEEEDSDGIMYLDADRLVADVEYMIEQDNPGVQIMSEEDVTQVNEGAVETSELVMAAKSMVDKYDQMIKDLSEMANEDLAPVADKVRDEMGSDVADNFTAQMTQALESTLAIMKADRATAETATRVLVGDQPAEPMGDDPIMTDEPDMEPTVDQDADDDFAAADAAMGGAEAEVGREKREA
tara:strand:+ start:1107 stop:2117 length:1011 start_codon:yes stop_codon:yes gene_type:complete